MKMIFIITLFIIVTQCPSEIKDVYMDTNKNATEIIIYTKPNLDLKYSNGKFVSSQELLVSELNRELENYEVNVNHLSGNNNNSKLKEDVAIFSIYVKGDGNKLRDYLLTLHTLIDAAYIKPTAEDPGL